MTEDTRQLREKGQDPCKTPQSQLAESRLEGTVNAGLAMGEVSRWNSQSAQGQGKPVRAGVRKASLDWGQPGRPEWPANRRDTCGGSSSWSRRPRALRPPPGTHLEQVLALWLQIGHHILQPLPGPLGEAALIVRQLGDSRPRGFAGRPQGPKDAKELVDLRVSREQSFAGHLRGRGEVWGPRPHPSQANTRAEARPEVLRPRRPWGKAPVPGQSLHPLPQAPPWPACPSTISAKMQPTLQMSTAVE